MPGRLGSSVNVTQVTSVRDDFRQFSIPCHPLTNIFEWCWPRMANLRYCVRL